MIYTRACHVEYPRLDLLWLAEYMYFLSTAVRGQIGGAVARQVAGISELGTSARPALAL